MTTPSPDELNALYNMWARRDPRPSKGLARPPTASSNYPPCPSTSGNPHDANLKGLEAGHSRRHGGCDRSRRARHGHDRAGSFGDNSHGAEAWCSAGFCGSDVVLVSGSSTRPSY